MFITDMDLPTKAESQSDGGDSLQWLINHDNTENHKEHNRKQHSNAILPSPSSCLPQPGGEIESSRTHTDV